MLRPARVFIYATNIVFLFFVLAASDVAALYLPESKASERLGLPSDLCVEPDIEFEGLNATERPTAPRRLYNRSPTVLSANHMRARLLDENQESRALLEVLRRTYQRDILVSETMLQDSVSNLGDLTQLRQVVRKLIAGQPITVVAVGGSITFGHGLRMSENVFINQFFSWLNETFPHPEHKFVNKAIPAVTSIYVSPCLLDLVPQDSDLVLVEFTFNDSERGARRLEDPALRAMERMLRKLQQLPNHPGIIMVHYWPGRHYKHDFANNAEDAINTILKFYGLMGISLRDALFPGFANDEAYITDLFQPLSNPDSIHPSCLGSRYLADLLIGHFQDLAAAELLYPFSSLEVRPAELGLKSQERHLGPSLQQNNWGNRTEACILEPEKFRDLVTPHEGFDWTDEGRSKWGYVGTAPGSSLEIEVPVAGLEGELTIGLGFLLSYEHMGVARIECAAGCECRPREYSFQHPYGISISGWRIVEITTAAAVDTCRLNVTILQHTLSEPPEHKVKLTSVMVTEEMGFVMPWLFCDECAE